jgi:hypothetical protein
MLGLSISEEKARLDVQTAEKVVQAIEEYLIRQGFLRAGIWTNKTIGQDFTK